MKTVWKFPLAIKDGNQRVPMPAKAMVILTAQQGASPTIWALVESDAEKTDRHFAVVGTGHPMPTDCPVYRGSCFQGPFVWHVFEVYP